MNRGRKLFGTALQLRRPVQQLLCSIRVCLPQPFQDPDLMKSIPLLVSDRFSLIRCRFWLRYSGFRLEMASDLCPFFYSSAARFRGMSNFHSRSDSLASSRSPRLPRSVIGLSCRNPWWTVVAAEFFY
ncbi:hypothetical protein QQ045_017602 [Rhodiola kirilowii]